MSFFLWLAFVGTIADPAAPPLQLLFAASSAPARSSSLLTDLTPVSPPVPFLRPLLNPLTLSRRLRPVLDCDKILVMDAGRVAEFDSPTELLAKKVCSPNFHVPLRLLIVFHKLRTPSFTHSPRRRVWLEVEPAVGVEAAGSIPLPPAPGPQRLEISFPKKYNVMRHIMLRCMGAGGASCDRRKMLQKLAKGRRVFLYFPSWDYGIT